MRNRAINEGDDVEQSFNAAGLPSDHPQASRARQGTVIKVEKSTAIVDFADTKGVLRRERVLLTKLRVIEPAVPERPQARVEERRPPNAGQHRAPLVVVPMPKQEQSIESEVGALRDMARGLVERSELAVMQARAHLEAIESEVADAKRAVDAAESDLAAVRNLAGMR